MKHIIIATCTLVLNLPAAAVDQCTGLAELASAVAEHKAADIPQAVVASALRAQYREDTEQQRDQNAMVERMLPVVYRLDEKPAEVRHVIYLKCKAGEFDPKKSAAAEIKD